MVIEFLWYDPQEAARICTYLSGIYNRPGWITDTVAACALNSPSMCQLILPLEQSLFKTVYIIWHELWHCTGWKHG